jgi:hypothetical protein
MNSHQWVCRLNVGIVRVSGKRQSLCVTNITAPSLFMFSLWFKHFPALTPLGTVLFYSVLVVEYCLVCKCFRPSFKRVRWAVPDL